MRRVVVLLLLTALLPAAAGGAAVTSAEALTALRAPTGLDELLGPTAAAAAAVLLTWLVAATLLVVVHAPRGGVRALGPVHATTARGTPAGRLAALLLGVGLTTLTPGPATALDPPSPPTAVAVHLDRPATDLRGWTPDRPAAPLVVPTTRRDERDKGAAAVVVRRGDSLWAIAERHAGVGATTADVAAAWPRWYAANRDRVGPDPDLLLPGTRLRLPAPADPIRGAS